MTINRPPGDVGTDASVQALFNCYWRGEQGHFVHGRLQQVLNVAARVAAAQGDVWTRLIGPHPPLVQAGIGRVDVALDPVAGRRVELTRGESVGPVLSRQVPGEDLVLVVASDVQPRLAG